MKRLLLALLVAACAVFAGCAQLLPTEYTQMTEHTEQPAAPEELDALTADSKASLKHAIRSLVQNGVEHGVIRVREYAGDVEADLDEVAYQVAREDPLGLYAVDYMTHDCSLIVSFYEIRIDITFRDFATEISEIPYVSNDTAATHLLYAAMDRYDDHLTMYLTYSSKLDYEALAESIAKEKDFYMKKISNITAAINGADDYIKLVKDVKAYVESALKDLPEDLYTYVTLKPVIY